MNNNVQLTTDSTADIPKEILEKYNIINIPLTVLLGDIQYKDDSNFDSNLIIKFVEETGIMPKTSAVSYGEYYDIFSNLTKNGKIVLHFTISSLSSSCYQNALNVSKELKNVYVIDTLALCSGQGLLVLKAVDLINQGKSVEEIISILEKLKYKTQTSFVLDNLDYLHKGGRCSSLQLIGSKLMKIHPSIIMKDGVLNVNRKYIGTLRASVLKYLADIKEDYKNKPYDKTRCCIMSTEIDKSIFDFAVEYVKQNFEFEEIITGMAGSTITSHCGAGTFALMFLGDIDD